MNAVAAVSGKGLEVAPVKRALVSVFDKSGLAQLGSDLAKRGVDLISTGGSARALEEAGLSVTSVESLTGFPEIMDGRVKTLHPKIHGGLLGVRENEAHRQAMAEHGIAEIDLVVVNLYPFQAVAGSGAPAREVIENIDIGGPAMIRAAAKNVGYVSVVVDPADYDPVLKAIENEGGIPRALRERLAAKAFGHTAGYDGAIARWYAAETGAEWPEQLVISAQLSSPLRYGENPHQAAALYVTDPGETIKRPGIANAEQVQGKPLSYNNINDGDAAYELIGEFDPDQPSVAIIKHANPCGVASGATLWEAYGRALRCDPVSAFGGVIALNRPIDPEAARAITEIFTEVVIAPGCDEESREIFARKPNLRLLIASGLPGAPGLPGPDRGDLQVRTLAGGYLVQSADNGRVAASDLRIVTKRAPTDSELSDLVFAFRVAKHVKSNTIVYAKEGATVGIGAGQMSRVDSARIAALKAREAAQAAGEEAPLTQGSVVASDAFFPFADGLMVAVEAGASAVIQPGGSMRDEEVIEAANAAGIAMVFTGMRHFRH